eukprot:12089595-Ditylum_brightwellii.AAC.1
MLRDFGENGDIVSGKDVEAFLTRLPMLRKGQHWYSHKSDILRFLIVFVHGGIYLDIDVYVLKPLDKTFVNILGKQSRDVINGAFISFERHHPFPGMALQWIILHYSVENMNIWPIIGPSLITKLSKNETAVFQSLTILPEAAIQPIPYERMEKECFENQQQNLNLTKTYAMHLNNKITGKFRKTKVGTPCDEAQPILQILKS